MGVEVGVEVFGESIKRARYGMWKWAWLFFKRALKSVTTCAFAMMYSMEWRFDQVDQKDENCGNQGVWNHFFEFYRGFVGVLREGCGGFCRVKNDNLRSLNLITMVTFEGLRFKGFLRSGRWSLNINIEYM